MNTVLARAISTGKRTDFGVPHAHKLSMFLGDLSICIRKTRGTTYKCIYAFGLEVRSVVYVLPPHRGCRVPFHLPLCAGHLRLDQDRLRPATRSGFPTGLEMACEANGLFSMFSESRKDGQKSPKCPEVSAAISIRSCLAENIVETGSFKDTYFNDVRIFP